MASTIKDIADRAGVSICTASRVLNNKQGLIKASEDTRAKILEVARELNYSPSIMAKGLRSGKSFLIGAIFPVVHGSFISEILQGAEDVINENDYNMILCTYKDICEFRKKLKVLNAKKVDGIITLPVHEKVFIESYIETRKTTPLVFAAGKIDSVDVPFAYVPPEEIAVLSAKYFLEMGHRNIGILGPRRGAFVDIFARELGKYPDARYYSSKEFVSLDAAMPEFVKMRKDFKDMTALLAYNDDVAAKIICEAGRMGIRVPEDISVMGIDDLPICGIVRPNITTIAQPRYEQGSEAARLLMDIINKENIQGGKALIPELIERESCCPPNRRDS